MFSNRSTFGVQVSENCCGMGRGVFTPASPLIRVFTRYWTNTVTITHWGSYNELNIVHIDLQRTNTESCPSARWQCEAHYSNRIMHYRPRKELHHVLKRGFKPQSQKETQSLTVVQKRTLDPIPQSPTNWSVKAQSLKYRQYRTHIAKLNLGWNRSPESNRGLEQNCTPKQNCCVSKQNVKNKNTDMDN